MRQLAGKVTNAPKWHTLEAKTQKTPHKSQDIKGLHTQAADKLRQHFFMLSGLDFVEHLRCSRLMMITPCKSTVIL